MPFTYQEYGDHSAPLMLFLHGGGVSGWMWNKQIAYFSHYHCIVPDLPEHGLKRHIVPFSIGGSAEEIIRLIEEKAKEKPVIVIGFSLGSQVLIQLLSMRPDLVDFAVINSALVRPLRSMKMWIRPMVKWSAPLARYRWFAKQQAKTLYVSDDEFETYFAESRHMKPDALVRVMEENLMFNIPPDFAKATGKLLVTVGEKEKSMMKKSASDLVGANANSVGVILPGIGHGAPLAVPDMFNALIETWICEDRIISGVVPIRSHT